MKHKNIKIAILLIIVFTVSTRIYSQGTMNYIVEKTYRDSIELNKNVTMLYFDGLGRPIQNIQVGASPAGKDMVQHIAYDDLGREVRKYLPYVSETAGGTFRSDAETKQLEFYNETINPRAVTKVATGINPWADIEFEESPLNRVLEQGAPGEGWRVKTDGSGNTVRFAYETNTSNEVIYFDVDTSNQLVKLGTYNEANLYKTATRDENGVWNSEYKNTFGKVVLKVSDTTSLKLQTYYVYDDYGLLRYTLPPKAVENLGSAISFDTTDAVIKNLCYYYEYDCRYRMVLKKLPGAAPVYMVYDKRDRLVLTQDGKLRGGDKWMFTKYDALNRPVMAGIYEHDASITRDSMQNIVGTKNIFAESKSGNYNDPYFGYTNLAFPVLDANDEILTVTYYGNYDFDTGNTIRDYVESITSIDYPVTAINYKVKGQVTGTVTRILDTDEFLKAAIFYDDKYRVARTYAENYLGGDDLVLNKIDYLGNVLKSKQIHYKDAGATTPTVIQQRYIYGHALRLKEVYHQVGTNPEVLMASYEYNELGQLVKKKLNKNVDDSFLQEIDYTYNIRGWTTKINDPDNLQETGQPKDMFAMELLYNTTLPTVNNTGDEQHNGNIAAIKWNTPEFGVKAYGYGYDEINRLERAKFAAGAALNADVNKYTVENITYDENGNIKTLGRHNTAAGFIDNLTMTYDGNRLKKTFDSGDLVLGFVDMVDYATEYRYDANGNMDIDDNKGFAFAYNYLNLPEEIVGGNDTVRYIYSATGVKVSKELVQSGVISYTDYIGNFVYKDGNLDYILIGEGRITEPTAGTYQYEYFLKDHLGNTRTVFADGNNDGVLADTEVLQENHYYPFGMSLGIDMTRNRGVDIKLKYNGKELQDDMLNGVQLNLYSYGWREYDPVVPHFIQIDPMIEKHYEWTGYAYVYNNPMRFSDPFGLDSIAAAEVTQAAENAVQTITDEYGETSKQCNRGVTEAFEEITENDVFSGKLANEMVDEMESSDDFETVDLEDVQDEANEGEIIIAGKKEADGESGHIALAVPEDEVDSGYWQGKAPVGMDTGFNKRWSKNGMNYSWTSKTGVKFYKYTGQSNKTYNVGSLKGATITAKGNKKLTPIQIVIKSTN